MIVLPERESGAFTGSEQNTDPKNVLSAHEN